MRGRILAAAALAMLVPHTARAALRGQPYVSSHTNFWSPGQPLRNKRALLGRSEELTVTEQVAKLQGWCDVRDDMTLSLGRQPTRDEWAQALGFQSSEEESAVEILEQQLREKRKAKETVVHANLGLVVSVATKYQDRGVPLPDLIQEGCIGLIRASEKFDPARGWRFSTYATYWIRQACQRAIYRTGTVIRLPTYMHARIDKVVRLQAESYARGVAASDEACAAELGLSEAQMRKTKHAMATKRPLLSLDTCISHSDDRALLSTVADDARREPSAEAAQAARMRALRTLLEGALEPSELTVVRLRYGLDCVPQSMKQISELHGCTVEQTRVDLQRALRKLKRSARRDLLE